MQSRRGFLASLIGLGASALFLDKLMPKAVAAPVAPVDLPFKFLLSDSQWMNCEFEKHLHKRFAAIASDEAIPFKVIKVSPNSYMQKIHARLRQRQLDPGTWEALPFPVQYQAIGGDSSDTFPNDQCELYDPWSSATRIIYKMPGGVNYVLPPDVKGIASVHTIEQSPGRLKFVGSMPATKTTRVDHATLITADGLFIGRSPLNIMAEAYAGDTISVTYDMTHDVQHDDRDTIINRIIDFRRKGLQREWEASYGKLSDPKTVEKINEAISHLQQKHGIHGLDTLLP